MKPPAPGPVSGLSATHDTRAAATAASTAFPPSSSTRAPACAVNGCPAATAPPIRVRVLRTRPTDAHVKRQMRSQLNASPDFPSMISRRTLIASGLFLGAVVVLVTMPGLFGHQVRDAMHGLGTARPIWLWSAGFAFLGTLLATSSAWRSTLALC